jgi:cytochrome c-type biogenesis protein CcmH/NrfF
VSATRLRIAALLASILACAALAGSSAAASPPAPKTTLPAIERQVMCVTCKIPLNVAQSTQADRERAFIQSLIDRGGSEAEIKSALVGQYGPTVLGLPAASGFDLTAYLVPLAVVVALLAVLAVLLPRWRRSARGQEALRSAPAQLAAGDAARLESDLSRFD